MTLTTRLTAFFLASQAAVLVGFSAGLFLLARGHLMRQVDERVRAGLDTVSAAAEVEPGGVEWEPRNRLIDPHRHRDDGAVRWTVRVADAEVIDRSTDPPQYQPLPELDTEDARPSLFADSDGLRWRVAARRIDGLPGETEQRGPGAKRYPALVFTAAVALDPVERTLARLAATLTVLTVAVLAVSLLIARRVCRRALAPVVRMADSARAMGAADLADRLPVSPTADELTDLGLAFNGLLDRLGEALARERRFAGEASHQLRTPLAGIIGQVEVALRRDRSAAEYQQVLEAVRAQTGRLSRVVEALLFLSRSDGEAAVPGVERIDLAAWVPEYLRVWAEHPRAGDVRIEPPGKPAWAVVHPDLFGEVLGALIDNALKYSQAGAPVVIRIGEDGPGAWVEVEDRGCGIEPADRAELFRPFFRSDAARRLGVPGAGLGLAVAARVAAALGGAIEVESAPGRGSRFRVTLPVEPVTGGGSRAGTRR